MYLPIGLAMLASVYYSEDYYSLSSDIYQE